MTEERKLAILFAATILAARKLIDLDPDKPNMQRCISWTGQLMMPLSFLKRLMSAGRTVINLEVDVVDQAGEPLVIAPRKTQWPIGGIFNTPVSFFIGTDEGVASYLAPAHSGDLYEGDLVDRARSFVQMEIGKQTPEIGGPIDARKLLGFLAPVRGATCASPTPLNQESNRRNPAHEVMRDLSANRKLP